MNVPFWILLVPFLVFAASHTPVFAQNSSDDVEQPTSSFGSSSESTTSTDGEKSKTTIAHTPIVGFGESDETLSSPGVLGTEGSGPDPILFLSLTELPAGEISLAWDGGSFTTFDLYRTAMPSIILDPANRFILGTTNTIETDSTAATFPVLFYTVEPAL